MKKLLRLPCLLLLFGTAVFYSCSFENNADIEATQLERYLEFGSAAVIGFTPVDAKACCYHRNTYPAYAVNGSTGGSAWQWGNSDTESWNNTDFEELKTSEGGGAAPAWNIPQYVSVDASDSTRQQGGTAFGHVLGGGGTPGTRGDIGRLAVPAHFITLDLGEIKTNIFRVGYFRYDQASRIAQYEIWVSDDPIGIEPVETTGEHWVHKAAEGTWPDSAAWLYADLDFVDARYIQVRSLADHSGNGTGPDTGNDFTAGAFEFNVDIAGAFTGTLDDSRLRQTYDKGCAMLASLKKSPKVYDRVVAKNLEPLLLGLYVTDEWGTTYLKTKGAAQLLEQVIPDDFTVTELITVQKSYDDMAQQILAVYNTISLGQ